jgi:hypothetical protein
MAASEAHVWRRMWKVIAGAILVVMHGAPLLHGVEIYRDRPIFFDLGNFIFQTALANIWEPIVWESVVAYVDFEGTTLKSIKFRPIEMNKIQQDQAHTRDIRTNNLLSQTNGLPRVATGEQAHAILQRLVDLSRPFGTQDATPSAMSPLRRQNPRKFYELVYDEVAGHYAMRRRPDAPPLAWRPLRSQSDTAGP